MANLFAPLNIFTKDRTQTIEIPIELPDYYINPDGTGHGVLTFSARLDPTQVIITLKVYDYNGNVIGNESWVHNINAATLRVPHNLNGGHAAEKAKWKGRSK